VGANAKLSSARCANMVPPARLKAETVPAAETT